MMVKIAMIIALLFQQPTVNVVPLHQSKILVQNVVKRLKEVYPMVNLLPERELPKKAYYDVRKRYRAEQVLAWLSAMGGKSEIYLGITNVDISTTKGDVYDYGIIGLGYQPGNACVISSYRLHKNNLEEELFKVAVHELGHNMGLPHCPNKGCYMQDAKGKNDSQNLKGFCTKCKKFLISKGWKIY